MGKRQKWIKNKDLLVLHLLNKINNKHKNTYVTPVTKDINSLFALLSILTNRCGSMYKKKNRDIPSLKCIKHIQTN